MKRNIKQDFSESSFFVNISIWNYSEEDENILDKIEIQSCYQKWNFVLNIWWKYIKLDKEEVRRALRVLDAE